VNCYYVCSVLITHKNVDFTLSINKLKRVVDDDDDDNELYILLIILYNVRHIRSEIP
jgi:hypothetical protein